jgi:hypothetical protein
MTFKEYFTIIDSKHKVFAVEEVCDGQYVDTHVSFGFNDATEEENDSYANDFVLFGTSGADHFTYIDVEQTIELKENVPAVYVKDREGNTIALTFFYATAIPHP